MVYRLNLHLGKKLSEEFAPWKKTVRGLTYNDKVCIYKKV